EYWCRRCGEKYELLRPIGRGDEPATCPKGHAGGARTLSTFSARVATVDAPLGRDRRLRVRRRLRLRWSLKAERHLDRAAPALVAHGEQCLPPAGEREAVREQR